MRRATFGNGPRVQQTRQCERRLAPVYFYEDTFNKTEGAVFGTGGIEQPAYGVYQGKVVYVEMTFRAKDLTSGKNWTDLPGLQHLTAIDHASFTFEPDGHGPSAEPDYVLRAWFAPPTELAKMRASEARKGQ